MIDMALLVLFLFVWFRILHWIRHGAKNVKLYTAAQPAARENYNEPDQTSVG